MNEQGSETSSKAGPTDDPEAAEERHFFAYQGSKVPLFVAFLWAIFLAWGVVYLVKWVPESWREWFSR